MQQVEQGSTIRVHCIGQLEDGTVLVSTRDGAPLEVTLGETELFRGVEQAMVGMTPGESKTIVIPLDRMIDPTREREILAIRRDRLRQNVDVKIGEQLELRQPGGRCTVYSVSDVSESDVILEARHFLLGGRVVFDIELIEILQG